MGDTLGEWDMMDKSLHHAELNEKMIAGLLPVRRHGTDVLYLQEAEAKSQQEKIDFRERERAAKSVIETLSSCLRNEVDLKAS